MKKVYSFRLSERDVELMRAIGKACSKGKAWSEGRVVEYFCYCFRRGTVSPVKDEDPELAEDFEELFKAFVKRGVEITKLEMSALDEETEKEIVRKAGIVGVGREAALKMAVFDWVVPQGGEARQAHNLKEEGSTPSPATNLSKLSPEEKRAIFERLKARNDAGKLNPEESARIGREEFGDGMLAQTDVSPLRYTDEPATDLHDTPCAPFDLNLEGEPHRVTQLGKRLGLFYLGGDEPVFNRYLLPGELEKFWALRIK